MTTQQELNALADGLTTLVLAIRDDPELSQWFEATERLPDSQRSAEIIRMRSALLASATSDGAAVATSLTLLVDTQVFQAASAAYRGL